MTTTVMLKKVLCGTEVSIVQEGIPEMIPAEMCHLGWRESLVVAIAIPVKPARGCQGSKLHRVRFLLEVTWRVKLWNAVQELSSILNQGHTTIFIATNKIEIAVLVPVDGGRRDHLEVHREVLARGGLQTHAERILRLRA